MNLDQAYATLELPRSASADEAKKKYRELTKKYHPDINKEPGAEDKFKQINKAYDLIQNGHKQPENNFQSYGINLDDLINNGFINQDFLNNVRQQRKAQEAIHLNVHLSFKDSIFGCKQEFKYNRDIKCEECNGQGSYALNNNCSECNGRGTIISKQGNMVMSRTCTKCGGRRQTESCRKCSSTGSLNTSISINVTIPGGVKNGNILKLEGMGNFVGVVNNFFQSGDAYTDALVHISVDSQNTFKVNGSDLETDISISLLEALMGCDKNVNTLDGSKKIKIKPKTKNNEKLVIPNLGVSRQGNQIVNINVEYPDDINNLVKFLENMNAGSNTVS